MSDATQYRKKLVEVALPLEAINRGCEADKNRKTGHIRNLHKWFAPMPLPAWRAMLFASVVDDPGEGLPDEMARASRARLVDLIERLSEYESYRDRALLKQVRDEIARSCGGSPPVVVDPFCGGGSTILEAQRLDFSTRASDLNPLPVLITTVLCKVPPLFRNAKPVHKSSPSASISGWQGLEGFTQDATLYAETIRERAWAALKGLYPRINGAMPYAYRWAWTVASPDPSVRGEHSPLVTDWTLSRHQRNRAWIDPVVEKGRIDFRLRHTGTPPKGTTGRSAAKCLLSGGTIPLSHVRDEGKAGRLRRVMFAIAAEKKGERTYLVPDSTQLKAAESAPSVDLDGIEMPEAALGFRVQQYGIRSFSDLFTPRQRASLFTFARLVDELHEEVRADALRAGMRDDALSLSEGGSGALAYADAVVAVLSLCVGKLAQSNNILVRWFIDPRNGSGKATPAFDRHAVPMVWDFVETNPFGGSVGDWTGPVLETALRAFELCEPDGPRVEVHRQDARAVAPALTAQSLIATDPPYYGNIGYADLSDVFYSWLRLATRSSFPELFATVAAPKGGELIATPFRHGGDMEEANRYFRSGFAEVFGGLAGKADPRFPMLVVYAIKQSEEAADGMESTGWEVFLGGLVDAGLTVVATWPVRTTTNTRMIGLNNNALASAIFVVCRPRDPNAPKGTRTEFMRDLREKLNSAVADLKGVSIAPVDLAQASIGPGMAVYSHFSQVLEADDSPMRVGTALGLINQVLDEILAEQENEFDRDSRWALAWFEQHGMTEGPYGDAELLSKAKDTAIAALEADGILEAKKGKVRLLRRKELAADWDPKTDTRPTVWEGTQHLIRRLEESGEEAAAELLREMGGLAEVARDLAYRLYSICEKKKWADEAISYNGLVVAWPELIRRSSSGGRKKPEQQELLS